MNAKHAVIDASVALKWRLRDEESTSQADALLDDFLASKLDLFTPTLFDYEIANALKVAATMGRLTEDEALTTIAGFRQYDITRCDFREIQRLAFQLAYQHRRSIYDSAYLALAQSKGLWFYTGDKKLFNAIAQTLPWAQWIGDYNFNVIPIV